MPCVRGPLRQQLLKRVCIRPPLSQPAQSVALSFVFCLSVCLSPRTNATNAAVGALCLLLEHSSFVLQQQVAPVLESAMAEQHH